MFVSLVAEEQKDLQALESMLSFWGIGYNRAESGAQIHIRSVRKDYQFGENSAHGTQLLLFGSESLSMFLQRKNIRFSFQDDLTAELKLDGSTTFYTPINRLCIPKGSNIEPAGKIGGLDLLFRIRETSTYLVAFDLLELFNSVLRENMDDIPSTAFRIFARFPVAYQIIPKPVRDYFLRKRAEPSMADYRKVCVIDSLYYLFLALLLRASQRVVPTLAFWMDGLKHAFAVTHDVETKRGLEELSSNLRSVEEDLAIKSTWNIPSHRYKINTKKIKETFKKEILGGHDTKHDGRLVLLSREHMIQRLALCKEVIGNLWNPTILGFRAPLLQHSERLLLAIREAGFLYDSSCPTWEPASCVHSGPHGIRTVFPLNIDGLIELPVTLPQDHQMLYVLRISPERCVQYWLEYSERIKHVGGMVMLLVHPEYPFSEEKNLPLYASLLRKLALDKTCWTTTTDELALWWKARCESSVGEESGRYVLKVSDSLNDPDSVKIRLFNGYDDAHGFRYLPHETRISQTVRASPAQ